MKSILVLALLFIACGINPVEGDWGVGALVPEKKTCIDTVLVWPKDGIPSHWRVDTVQCDGRGHDWKWGWE